MPLAPKILSTLSTVASPWPLVLPQLKYQILYQPRWTRQGTFVTTTSLQAYDQSWSPRYDWPNLATQAQKIFPELFKYMILFQDLTRRFVCPPRGATGSPCCICISRRTVIACFRGTHIPSPQGLLRRIPTSTKAPDWSHTMPSWAITPLCLNFTGNPLQVLHIFLHQYGCVDTPILHQSPSCATFPSQPLQKLSSETQTLLLVWSFLENRCPLAGTLHHELCLIFENYPVHVAFGFKKPTFPIQPVFQLASKISHTHPSTLASYFHSGMPHSTELTFCSSSPHCKFVAVSDWSQPPFSQLLVPVSRAP